MKKLILKLSVLVMILTLVTLPLVSGTYAKYTTTVVATDTVTVAKWVANFDNNGGSANANFNFDLIGTLDDTGVNGDLLAPGTQGSFDLTYNTSGTKVARDVKITMNASSTVALENLKFYSDHEFTPASEITTAVKDGTAGNLLNAQFSPDDKSNGGATLYGASTLWNTLEANDTLTVYWQWLFNGDDAADTVDGLAAGNFGITVTFNATQLDTYATVTP